MRITKFIDIRQEIEIDLSVEDITLVFDEAGEINIEQRGHIYSQLNSIIQFLTALPQTFIDQKMDYKLCQSLHKSLTTQIEKFKNKVPDTKQCKYKPGINCLTDEDCSDGCLHKIETTKKSEAGNE